LNWDGGGKYPLGDQAVAEFEQIKKKQWQEYDPEYYVVSILSVY
jgi:hypothetical protein